MLHTHYLHLIVIGAYALVSLSSFYAGQHESQKTDMPEFMECRTALRLEPSNPALEALLLTPMLS